MNFTPDAGVDAAPEPDAWVPRFQLIGVQELRDNFRVETYWQTYVDLRPLDDCNAAHLPDAICRPVEWVWQGGDWVQDGAAITTATFSFESPLFFYGTAAMRDLAIEIGQAALDLGYQDVYVVDGGIEAWRAMGWYQDINFEGIVANYYNLADPLDPLPPRVFLIDNMDLPYYTAGHIAGALLLDIADLQFGGQLVNGGQALLDIALPVDTDAVIFTCVNEGCGASEEGSEAAEKLSYPNILHYRAGFEDWELRGGPVHTGPNP